MDIEIAPVNPDLTIPDGARCQEASSQSAGFYIPCGRRAVSIVDNGDSRPYYMCDWCTSHNVGNRAAVVLAGWEPEKAPASFGRAPSSSLDWPKHPDGRNKKVGEMSPVEKDRVLRPILERLKPVVEKADADGADNDPD